MIVSHPSYQSHQLIYPGEKYIRKIQLTLRRKIQFTNWSWMYQLYVHHILNFFSLCGVLIYNHNIQQFLFQYLLQDNDGLQHALETIIIQFVRHCLAVLWHWQKDDDWIIVLYFDVFFDFYYFHYLVLMTRNCITRGGMYNIDGIFLYQSFFQVILFLILILLVFIF